VSDIVVAYDFLPKLGGAHTWLYQVYRRWHAPVAVFTTCPDSDPAEAARERAFDAGDHGALTIHRQALRIGELDLLDPRCWRAYARHRAGIAHLAGAAGRQGGGKTVRLHALRAFPEGIAAYLYRLTHPKRSRLVTYAHGEEVLVALTSRQLRYLAKRVYAASDLVIANSENTRQIVQGLCPTARVVCIHPGVDAGAYVRSPEEVRAYRARWRWPPETLVVSVLGRMEPRKNHAAVIRAVSALRAEGLPIALVCGGDGPERAALEALARGLDAGDWIRFTGRVAEEEKALMYAASDLYAMPAIRHGEMIEGFGIVFLEAAAAGLPAVSGNSGGQREAVLDGRTGIVVDGTRIEAVVEAIRALASDPPMRARMGAAARAWAAEHDWRVVTARTEAAIAELA